jgi:hypothetical protein
LKDLADSYSTREGTGVAPYNAGEPHGDFEIANIGARKFRRLGHCGAAARDAAVRLSRGGRRRGVRESKLYAAAAEKGPYRHLMHYFRTSRRSFNKFIISKCWFSL